MMGINDKNEDTDVWKTIENDQYLSQFLATGNKKKCNENLSILACTSTVSEQLNKLTKGINLLDKELQSLIFHHHNDLITQGTWVEKLENALNVMRTHVQELLNSVVNVRNKIVEPYNEIETQCLILTRLHETSNILRCIIEIQKLAKNLSKYDILKASSLIKEVDDFCEDIDLTGINIIENDKKIIEKERRRIHLTARNKLIETLNEENESQIQISVQVFLNLNVLEQEIQNLKEYASIAIEDNTKRALDIQFLMNQSSDQEKVPKIKNSGPGRITGGTFPGINVDAFRAKLWSNWGNLIESVVYPNCAQMYLLQYAIIKQYESKFNPENSSLKINDFWNQISDILSKYLITAAEESTFIKQALEGEYPRLIRLHIDMNKKLRKLVSKYPIKSSSDITQCFSQNNHFAEKFENAYLSRSISRLLDGVHAMFSGEGLPSTEEMDSFTRSISSELSVSLIDDNLCKTVGRNIGKAICLFCLKCEQLIAVEGNASQVIDIENTAQQTNVNIANTVYYMKQHIQNILVNMSAKLPEYCKNDISKVFLNSDELLKNILEPLKSSISESIESIILTMHQENFQSDTDYQSNTTSSLYLRELQEFIKNAYANYLKAFQCQEILQKCCSDLANRCIELFLRHACLLRPLRNGGRRRLNEDFKKIETAVSPLCPDISTLGDNYRILRSFRLLVKCTDPQKIAENEFVGKVIPYSTALMFLFSYAPAEIPSPHVSCSWSIARLSQWLDKHESEREKLELISGILQRYQQDIRQQNKTQFHEVYPIMINLLENGFKSLKFK